jgi:thioredoxin-like negative regulator of GroEL
MSTAARRYYLRGKAALDSGDVDGALEGLSAAVELSPRFVAARLAYAAALAGCGDCPRAAQTLRAGLGRADTATERGALLASLGDVLVRGGDFRGAEEAYAQLDGDPRFAARAAAGRARVAAKTGDFAASFAALQSAARMAGEPDAS